MADAETAAALWFTVAKPLGIAVVMLWVAAAAEVSGPLLISYFIDNMVAKNNLPLAMVAGLVAAYVGLQLLAAGLHYVQSLLFNGLPSVWCNNYARM